MSFWIDPRTNPTPPYRGPERPLAQGEAELADLIAACKQGRIYDVEAWVASGRPLQLDPDAPRRSRHRVPSVLALLMAAGSIDLMRLLLCNGYRPDLEPQSPLDDAMDARRWDLLDLLLAWGADPTRADVGTILATYDRALFERFRAADVDLTADGAMAEALSTSASNRPLYGFAKAHRAEDSRIQRALDLALGAAIDRKSEKAVSLCLWAGADPRRRLGDIGDDPAEDPDGMTAFERAVFKDAPELLKKLGFDPAKDDIDPLYAHAYRLTALHALAAIRPPANWTAITQRFINSLAFSVRVPFLRSTGSSLYDLESVFELGGRIDALDRDLKIDLRRLLLSLDDRDAQRLFRLLSNPEKMDRKAFLELIAHDKLAARYEKWSWYVGVSKALWAELIAAPGVPAPVRRLAKARVHPPKPVKTHTLLGELGADRLMSREEVYELVWSEPLTSLARRFGISDNGLRKRCKAMNVPTPPKGYWRRVELGRKPRRAPLPKLDAAGGTPPARRSRTPPI